MFDYKEIETCDNGGFIFTNEESLLFINCLLRTDMARDTSKESKESFQGKLVFNSDEAYKHGLGAYFWNKDKTVLWIMIPDPHRDDRGCCLSPWHIRPNKNDGGHSWQWDGNEEKPTLTPSLHAVGFWHGFLKGGYFQSV